VHYEDDDAAAVAAVVVTAAAVVPTVAILRLHSSGTHLCTYILKFNLIQLIYHKAERTGQTDKVIYIMSFIINS
jgi:hypothetical protein